jgi:hypothetical protein
LQEFETSLLRAIGSSGFTARPALPGWQQIRGGRNSAKGSSWPYAAWPKATGRDREAKAFLASVNVKDLGVNAKVRGRLTEIVS